MIEYYGDREIPLAENGKLTPAAKTEAVQQLKHQLKNSSGYEGGRFIVDIDTHKKPLQLSTAKVFYTILKKDD